MGSIEAEPPVSSDGPPSVDTILYFKDVESEREVVHSYTPSSFKRPMNAVPSTVHNVRGREHEFSFDNNGIEWFKAPSAFKYEHFDEKDNIAGYIRETENILKERLGASHVLNIGPTFRRHGWPSNTDLAAYKPADDLKSLNHFTVAREIHIDTTPKSAPETLHDALQNHNTPPLPASLDLDKCRWAYLSLWRPLKPVLRDPFAAADARTIRQEDLVVFDKRIPHAGIVTENYNLKHRPDGSQKFYFQWNMKPEEVMLVRFFDTAREPGCPHTAFEDPQYVDREPRESVEVRLFAFWEQ